MSKYCKYIYTDRLRNERFSNNFSMEHMAKALGKKSRSSYQNLEVGNIEPKITDMINISKIFNKPVDYFFNFNVQGSQTTLT